MSRKARIDAPGAYEPQVPLVVLILHYTVFVGLVFYLVLTLSDPFQSNIGIALTSFEYLVEVMRSNII